jgi:formamidopyrimidine-DNA glycosylase
VPELPEVEVVRSGLSLHIAGRRIAGVDVLHPRSVRRHEPGAAHFRDAAAGQWISAARRRGKYLWLALGSREGSADRAVLAHLGMSGQMRVQPSGAPDEAHLRVRFSFTDGGTELRFVDQRTFGGLALAELGEPDACGERVPSPLAHIARDPMDPRFDPERVAAAMRRRHSELKRALLDQSLVSGIGNIYADEALWRAELHGARATFRLARPHGTRLLAAATDVMTEALAAGGTSFDQLYVNVNGQSGFFDRSMDVYGRGGLPCKRCGSAVGRERFMNRSSYCCPRCQPRPRRKPAAESRHRRSDATADPLG